jgi:hypothetical protein
MSILEVERSDVSGGHVTVGNASALSELNHRLAKVASGQLQGRIACPECVKQDTVSAANFEQVTGLLNEFVEHRRDRFDLLTACCGVVHRRRFGQPMSLRHLLIVLCDGFLVCVAHYVSLC